MPPNSQSCHEQFHVQLSTFCFLMPQFLIFDLFMLVHDFFSQVSGLPTKELFPFSHACKTVLTVGLRRLAGKCSFKKPVQCKGKDECKSSPEYRKIIWKEIPLGCQPSSAVANTENTQRPFPRQQQDAPGLMLGMLNERCLKGFSHIRSNPSSAGPWGWLTMALSAFAGIPSPADIQQCVPVQGTCAPWRPELLCWLYSVGPADSSECWIKIREILNVSYACPAQTIFSYHRGQMYTQFFLNSGVLDVNEAEF